MSRKVILILADGMRPDSIDNLPYVKELMKKSAYAMHAETTFPSVTLPCHFSLFLSVPTERHGISTNTYMPPVRPIDGLFEQLNRAKKVSAVFYDWEQLRDLWKPGTVAYSQFIRESVIENDDINTETAIEYIDKSKPDFVFHYLGNPDWAGHTYGWMTDEYAESIRRTWANIEKLVERYSDEYTFIITADHGGHDRIHGTDMPEDMLIPLMLLGPDFKAGEISGANIMDIAPTIAKLMGAECSPEWEGKSLI